MKQLNKLIFYSFCVMLIVSSVGCEKSYLQKDPSTGVALNIAITSESDLKAATAGIYAQLRDYRIYGRNLIAKGDIMSDNVYVSSSNTGRQAANFNVYNFIATDADATNIFNYLYDAIKRCNQVINSSIATSANVNEYKGEAYAARALCYLDLVRNFAYPYAKDTSAPGVPIVTTFNSDAKPARSSVGTVYKQIISDLEAAYGLMTIYQSSGYLSKYAARALEARVYMDMADWTNAKTVALDVINNGGFSLVTSANYVAYWGDPTLSTNKQEIIFEIACDATNNNGTEALSNLYSQSSYGDYLVTKDLYNVYASTDIRRSLIVSGTHGGFTVWVSKKYPNTTSTTDRDDVPILRYAETLLILAEAYYNLNDNTNALKYLNMVAQQRDPSFAGYTSTGASTLENILLEKRKEFAFEGLRYWDLYRLQRTFTKVVEENPYTSLNIVVPTTKGVRFPIPQSETDANINDKQNAEYQ